MTEHARHSHRVADAVSWLSQWLALALAAGSFAVFVHFGYLLAFPARIQKPELPEKFGAAFLSFLFCCFIAWDIRRVRKLAKEHGARLAEAQPETGETAPPD